MGAILASLVPALVFAQSSSSSSSSSEAIRVPQDIQISQQTGVEVRGDFQVGPTRFVLEMDPGESRTIEVDVTSREGQPESYNISAEDFSVSDDGTDNIRFYGNGFGPFSAKSWIQPAVSGFSLNHGARASVPVKVTVPQNAAVGDHYAVVLFQRRLKDQGKDGFNIIPRIGALLLITVRGDVIHKGALQNFNVSRRVYWSLPAQFAIQYRNTGTVHMIPTGHIEIKNIFGITVDDIPVKDWYVLRNSTRLRSVIWQPHFALGYYTATLTIGAEGQEVVGPVTVSYWVVPALQVFLVLLAIFAVSFLVQAFFSHFELRRKKSEDA